MTKTLYLGIAAGFTLALYIVLTLLVIVSPHLGFWWQVGLTFLFSLGVFYSFKQLGRLNQRDKVMADLFQIEKTQIPMAYTETFNYIRKNLR